MILSSVLLRLQNVCWKKAVVLKKFGLDISSPRSLIWFIFISLKVKFDILK